MLVIFLKGDGLKYTYSEKATTNRNVNIGILSLYLPQFIFQLEQRQYPGSSFIQY